LFNETEEKILESIVIFKRSERKYIKGKDKKIRNVKNFKRMVSK
jgi:hypothetical protein